MSLSLAEVRQAATLSRLRLTAAEEVLFAEQLGRIVAHIDHLREFETLVEEVAPASGIEASDEPQPYPCAELLLENAPEVRGAFFAVARMTAGAGGAAGEDPIDE